MQGGPCTKIIGVRQLPGQQFYLYSEKYTNKLYKFELKAAEARWLGIGLRTV